MKQPTAGLQQLKGVGEVLSKRLTDAGYDTFAKVAAAGEAGLANLDYWESGMDLGLSRDIFDSFLRYQKLIQKEFNLMQQEYGFHVVSGNRSVRSVSREIAVHMESLLGI